LIDEWIDEWVEEYMEKRGPGGKLTGSHGGRNANRKSAMEIIG
jgi:hypothetical protein